MKDPVVVEVHAENDQARQLKELAMSTLEKIAKLKEERKNCKEMIESSLLSDELYRTTTQATTEAKVNSDREKNRVMTSQSVAQFVDKKKEIGKEIRELTDAVSDYLGEYSRMTGNSEISDKSGKRWTIVKKYKICAGQQRMF